jgi:predicted nucleic acid-binding protein
LIYLADKSALARLSRPSVDRRLGPLILAGEVATCGIIDLELLYSARSHADLVEVRREREGAFTRIAMEQQDFDRAADLMSALARAGKHRAAGIPDLLIAAVAERAGLILLHYDADFDVLAAHSRLKAEWVVPRGSVP